MTPNLNQMAVVGLVSIPGMMTGQLLGGSSPAVAAQYQMAILWLILATGGLSSYAGMALAVRSAVADPGGRLTLARLRRTKKSELERVAWELLAGAAGVLLVVRES